MEKLQYNVVERDTKNASGKAKKDVCRILFADGFRYLYKPMRNRFLRVIQQLYAISCLDKDVCLFVQYPANLNVCYNYLKWKACFKIAIIHDLESLRGSRDAKEELSILNSFDLVISHNARMSLYLEKNGLKAKIFNLDIFDYLMPEHFSVVSEYDKKEIAFAGNLAKSTFLQKIGALSDFRFSLYGSWIKELDMITRNKNVSYLGSFASEALIENLRGGWGLVWDGNSIDTCNGINGEYMRYNCPHKVSMYIVAERPIIIWKEAAMADYVINNNLGIAIDSLHSLQNAMSKISDDDYMSMIVSVRREKKKLINGEHLDKIVRNIKAEYLL